MNSMYSALSSSSNNAVRPAAAAAAGGSSRRRIGETASPRSRRSVNSGGSLRVAILEDDVAQADLMRCTMEGLGHGAYVFHQGRTLLRQLGRESFDLLILDWQLPDVSGPDVAQWVRSSLSDYVPILMVTARGDESDIVRGLSCGVDDYLVKPIRLGEFVARTRALVRRAYPDRQEQQRTYGPFAFDYAQRTVHANGQLVDLKRREFDLAVVLFENLGRMMSRQHLAEALWGFGVQVESRTLDTHVSSIRTKLNLRPESGFRLSSIYGVGYRLETIEVDAPEA